MAQQIAKHPLDPYGFDLNWSSFLQPMSVVMQNPPLCSYFIAVVASLFGWSEFALHVAFLFWASMSILGTFTLAQRFCQGSIMVALLTLFTPVFVVSASSVMCDVMMLAIWVWAVEFWLDGFDRKRSLPFLVSALLISAAALTKYFGITLVPLLAAYTLARERRFTLKLAYLLIPIAIVSNYDFLTEAKYGHGLFSAAMSASSSISSGTRPSAFAELLMGLAFGGGCFFSALFFAPFWRKKLFFPAIIGFIVLAAAFKFAIVSWIYLETSEALVWLEGALFGIVGLGILTRASINLVQRRNAEALLLALWVLGTFCFAAFFNWSVTARTFLPIAPAVAILVIQEFERIETRSWLRSLPFVAAAALSLLIAVADYQQANCGRLAASLFRERYAAQANKVVFLGHWGFQYYMQRWGATAFDRSRPEVASGDILVGSFGDPKVSVRNVVNHEESAFNTLPFLSTSTIGTGASFYSSFGGPLPWAINKISPARYFAVETR